MRRYVERPPKRISAERVRKRSRRAAYRYPAKMLDKLCRAQKNKCAYCGRAMTRGTAQTRATVDHVVPLSGGGRTRYGNVVAACAACNHAKGSMGEAEFRDAIAMETHRAETAQTGSVAKP
jgi:5-methylcytosine-specific restriction endonuclease McrA